MKCVCGHEEPEEWEEEVEVLFQSGPRKGQVKKVETVVHEVDEKDKFIKIEVEKDFGFVVVEKPMSYYSSKDKTPAELYACPKCSTVKMSRYW